MDYLLLLINTLYCLVSSFLAFDFMNKIFERTYVGNYKKYYLILTLMMIILNSFQNTYLNYVGTFLFFFTLCKKLYFSNKSNIYLYTLFYVFIMISIEVITYIIIAVFASYFSINTNTQYILTVMVSIIMDLIVYRYFINHYVNNLVFNYNLYKIEFLTLMRSLVVIIGLCMMAELNISLYAKISIFILCSFIVICDLILLYLLENKASHDYYENNKMPNELKNQIEFDNYEEELDKYDKQRKLIHDIKDHLIALENMYILGDQKMAKKYNKQLMDEIKDRKKFSDDLILEVFLNKVYRQCLEKDIEFIFSIKDDVNLDFVSEFDKVVIFSNILKNAYEASVSSTIANKYIILDIKRFNNAIVIHLSNAFNTKIIKKDNYYLSTKCEHSGLGLKNVMNTVHKLGGIMNISQENNQFKLMIYLPKGD